ncbi:hypothetical protein [Salinisphaera sp. G21_0]|uniref:hypothetical protein n=1 Tax=Salinisphaera sp. G21_0 TaxID=2821094 RepID=UPI001ADB78B8|nr:hypothetical protein [Salinisphaera sp. G21_0]MBO9480531.1 hypothetical protein [Salinisphaera sp. G21_0]
MDEEVVRVYLRDQEKSDGVEPLFFIFVKKPVSYLITELVREETKVITMGLSLWITCLPQHPIQHSLRIHPIMVAEKPGHHHVKPGNWADGKFNLQHLPKSTSLF